MSTKVPNLTQFYKIEGSKIIPFEGDFHISITPNQAKKSPSTLQIIFKQKGHELNNKRLSSLFALSINEQEKVYKFDLKSIGIAGNYFLRVSLETSIVEILKGA